MRSYDLTSVKNVPTGEIGECIARGPSVMSGYYNQLEITAMALKD